MLFSRHAETHYLVAVASGRAPLHTLLMAKHGSQLVLAHFREVLGQVLHLGTEGGDRRVRDGAGPPALPLAPAASVVGVLIGAVGTRALVLTGRVRRREGDEGEKEKLHLFFLDYCPM